MDMEVQEEEFSIPVCYDSLETVRTKLLSSSNGNGITVNDTRPFDVTTKKTIIFKECQKNHAAHIGGHATDGCGEFMPSGEEGTLDALRCAACDCHRNFHRREVEGEPCFECHEYYEKEKDKATSPKNLPDRSAFPFSTSAMLGRPIVPLVCTPLSAGVSDSEELEGSAYVRVANPSAIRKRFRTKFTAEQKERMFSMAEKLGWRVQKHDEAEIQQFCSDVGVKPHVLKVWMHNNKQILGKR